MSEQVIVVQRREETGDNASRRYRAAGQVPAVVYGAGKESFPISVDRKTVLDLIKKGGGENSVFLLKLEGTGQERHAMIKDLQVEPTTRQILHIDFLRLLMDAKIRVSVPVELTGVPLGVKNEGGLMDFVTREVEVECLPADIPKHVELDITELHMGQHVEAKDIALPPAVTLMTEGSRVIASLVAPKKPEVTGEEAEALLEAGRDEPEVIRRGKQETEG